MSRPLSRFSLGTKVTLTVALVQIPVFALVTILYIHEARLNQLDTITWHARALVLPLQKRASILSGYAHEMQRTLGLGVDCQTVLKEHRHEGLEHVGVIDNQGVVIAHTDRQLVGKAEHASIIKDLQGQSEEPLVTLNPYAYDALIPIIVDGQLRGAVDVGISRKTIDQKIQKAVTYGVLAFLLFLPLSFLLINGLLKRFVTQPIIELSKAALILGRGVQEGAGQLETGHDEIDVLTTTFANMELEIQQQIEDLNREINERQKAERQLSEHEEDLRVTLNSIGDAVIATDIKGRITRMNPIAEALTGWPLLEACTQPLNTVFHVINALTRSQAENPVEKVLETGEIVGLANHTVLIAKDGTERQIADSGAPIKNDQGQIIGVVLVFRDVTEEYAMQDRLRHSEKMDAIGQLTGGIAHDFNNILGIILGNLDFLERMVAGDEKALKRVKSVDKAAQRAADLTKQLLGFSRKHVRETHSANLNQIIQGMDSLVTRSVTPEVEVSHNLAGDLWLTEIDSGDLEDVLLNIILNARDAMPDGGKLTIETSNVVLDATYAEKYPTVVPGEYVELAVSDTGSGISKDDLDHIFEPFYTTKHQGNGTGLGMSMVFGFIQRSKGHIKVYSELGIGTTIRCYLPRSNNSTEEYSVPTAKDSQLLGGQETILVVDDEKDLLDLAQQSLEELGYSVLTAISGQHALEMLSENPTIDLIFSDVVMPGGMGGYDLAEQAIADHPGIKVLLSSGYTGKTVVHNGQARFATNLLSKPYTIADLSLRVRKTLDDTGSNETA
ncbi:MAG: response regulator [Desulfobulbaceae bacterium]|nr:response regulator [Desulfobulbaceae bacterium]